MSKKQARSEQEVDLPDWADEVTPADEVMRKFYAPTGAFKPGPIVVRPPAAPPGAAPSKEAKEEGVDAQVAPQAPAEPAPDAPAVSPISQTSVAEKQDARVATSLPSPERESRKPAGRRAAAPRMAGDITRDPLEGTQATPFGEFAKKWSRYLYPGQLAVMRELYGLTIERGVTDCFTRYSEIATATKMTRRNCINVVNSLVERGFVERLEVRNDATGKGITLRIHTEPQL
jgi:DNA-binding MarR family transcriptional regulator